MKIGIDIDDTIVDFFEDFLSFCNEDLKINLGMEDLIERGFWNLLGSREKMLNILKKYIDSGRIYERNVFEDFLQVFEELNKEQIFLITARSYDKPKKTKEFLKSKIKNFNSDIYYSQNHPEGTKLAICNDLGIDFMIEDGPNEAKLCAENGIKVFLLDKPWNRKIFHENIIRVNDWKDFLSKFKEMKNGN
jgi:uncharacterized HAD superfamily protein